MDKQRSKPAFHSQNIKGKFSYSTYSYVFEFLLIKVIVNLFQTEMTVFVRFFKVQTTFISDRITSVQSQQILRYK